ncbi:hypothetical protein KI387_015376, partial [Taxus chinensis]
MKLLALSLSKKVVKPRAQQDEGSSSRMSNVRQTNHSTQGSSWKPAFIPKEEAIPDIEPRVAERRDIRTRFRLSNMTLSKEIRDAMSFVEFMGLDEKRTKPRHATPHKEVQSTLGKLSFSTFDGSSKGTARAWIQKLNTYLSLKPMLEEEAIKFATLHLEGIAHEWWFHGL